MCICHNCANLLTTSISSPNLSADNTHHLLATVANNIPALTNSNTTTKLTSNWNTKAKNDTTKLEIETCSQNLETKYTQNPNFQYYLSLLVTPKNTSSNNQKPNQNKSFTSNISLATITNNKLLAAIFSFEFEEPSQTPLFSGAVFKKKPITAMCTNAKVDDQAIKLILNSNQLSHRVDCTTSTRIITANEVTKTSIGKIDDFFIEVNGIIVPIKILVMEATQYQALIVRIDDTHKYQQHVIILNPTTKKRKKEKKNIPEKPSKVIGIITTKVNSHQFGLEKKKKKKRERRKISTNHYFHLYTIYLLFITPEYSTTTKFYYCPCVLKWFGRPKRQKKWDNKSCLACGTILGTCDKMCQYIILINDWVYKKTSIDDAWKKIWRMASTKAEDAMTSELLEIKNNPLSFPKPKYVQMFNVFGNIEDNPKEFHEHYQCLAPTREEQKQHLEEINTQLCDYCLIPYDFQYCNEYNFIYNLPPRMVYMITEEDKPISSCISESELSFNPDSNFNNNDDNNNSSSSIQIGNSDNNDSNSNSNSTQYIILLNLTKEQKLRWFSNNNEDIMPECMHDTDAGFDLKYLEKNAIKLESHSHTCINLKVALKIPATTMVQLAFRSSLTKKKSISEKE
ncbi:hypothetical protein G9A89_012889 [Geosiphon pyriformis]|nr:hypothetical protein G9A89_012889 [Geosiphon pyriformis]